MACINEQYCSWQHSLCVCCSVLQVQFYARAFLPLKHRCGRRQAASVNAAPFACSHPSGLALHIVFEFC
jgi:hypothetical protein